MGFWLLIPGAGMGGGGVVGVITVTRGIKGFIFQPATRAFVFSQALAGFVFGPGTRGCVFDRATKGFVFNPGTKGKVT